MFSWIHSFAKLSANLFGKLQGILCKTGDLLVLYCYHWEQSWLAVGRILFETWGVLHGNFPASPSSWIGFLSQKICMYAYRPNPARGSTWKSPLLCPNSLCYSNKLIIGNVWTEIKHGAKKNPSYCRCNLWNIFHCSSLTYWLVPTQASLSLMVWGSFPPVSRWLGCTSLWRAFMWPLRQEDTLSEESC